MIRSIVVHNRFHMDLVVNNMRKIPHKHWHLISISSPLDPKSNISAFTCGPLVTEKNRHVLEYQECDEILPLAFHDLRDDHIELCKKQNFVPILFSDAQAKQVIDFIAELQKEKEDSVLVIHCDAGISRSGAVAVFVSEYCKIPFHDPYIRPNTYVLRMLWSYADKQKDSQKDKNEKNAEGIIIV